MMHVEWSLIGIGMVIGLGYGVLDLLYQCVGKWLFPYDELKRTE